MVNIIIKYYEDVFLVVNFTWEFHDFLGCDFSVFDHSDRSDHRDDIETFGSVQLKLIHRVHQDEEILS